MSVAGMTVRAARPVGVLHAKHLTIDDQVAVIGTTNLDIRSFALNAEVHLVVYDSAVVADLARVQAHYFADSDVLDAAAWQRLTLEKAASQLLEECRMVLPGVQALLGFQLVAVFDSAFAQELSRGEQLVHLAAMLCVVMAVALVMAPAAIHRLREPNSVSSGFVRLSSRLLMLGMIPLAAGTTADIFLIGHVLSKSFAVAALAAAFCVAVFLGLWLVVPWRARLT